MYPLVLYRRACPNCGGIISSDRLLFGLPCHKCLPEEYVSKVRSISDLITLLKTFNKLKGFKIHEELLRNYQEFEELFQKLTRTKMWGAQRLWARRLIKGKSFAIIAPTGSGKTTFGIVASIYIALRNGKVLFILPTSTLAYQVYKKMIRHVEEHDEYRSIRVVTYNSLMSKSEREEAMAKIRSGDFDVLIITNMFLPKYMDVLSDKKFNLIFVDDVDSVLKASSKNIDRLLLLLGVNKEVLEHALKAVELIKTLRKLKRIGASDDEIENIRNQLRDIESKLRDFIQNTKLGILIASGALTKTRRAARLFLFREFLGFETGGKAEGLRNVVDTYIYPEKDLKETVLSIVKTLGDGGLIFIPTDLGKEFAEELEKYLINHGVNVKSYLKPRRTLLEDYSKGEIGLLIGLATSRSALVRGIDLPHRVRYVVFVGVPKIKFRIKISEFTPGRYLTFFFSIRNAAPEDYKLKMDRLIARLRNIMGITQTQLNKILQHLEEGKTNELSGFERYVAELIKECVSFARDILSRLNLNKLDIQLEVKNDDVYVTLPDAVTYIQGSGRCSRMYVGGITHGISVLIVDDDKVFRALSRELKYRLEDFEFKHFNEIQLDTLLKVINEEREEIMKIMKGEVPPRFAEYDPLKSIFIIVESPTKARTIASFFGKPSVRIVNNLPVYEVSTGNYLVMVAATKGHIWELVPSASIEDKTYVKSIFKIEPKDYYGIFKVSNDFIPIYNTIKKCPICNESYTEDFDLCPKDKVKLMDSYPIIDALRDIATEVDYVLLGTDPDSEGEKISWDVYLMLKPYIQNIMRIEFHEVTRRAIFEAVNSPRVINLGMVKAQLIRRIEDRWIGFGLSQKLQEKFGLKTLSAGRVQTPVLGWIIQQYFKTRENKVYRLAVKLENNAQFVIDVPIAMRKLVSDLTSGKAVAEVKSVVEELREISPPPPYTTDTLLKDASNILKIDVETTMKIAQDLFESGLITYHRTDSTRVSSLGISIAKEYIFSKVTSEYFTPRQWITHGHIGAHECIRPTRPIDVDELRNLVNSGIIQLAIRLTSRHYAIYDLIFRRFIASQMRNAIIKLQKFKLIIKSLNTDDKIEIDCENVIDVIEYGFTKIYPVMKISEPISEGVYKIIETSKPVRTSKEKLLREGDVIALMKERGIGRPSTYAKIVDIILRRKYAITVGKFKYLVPTKKGIEIYKYLIQERDYEKLVSEERTRIVEKLMDDVESGERDYKEVLTELFEEIKDIGILKD